MSAEVDSFVAAVLAHVQIKSGKQQAEQMLRTFEAAAREFPTLAAGYRRLLDTLPENEDVSCRSA